MNTFIAVFPWGMVIICGICLVVLGVLLMLRQCQACGKEIDEDRS